MGVVPRPSPPSPRSLVVVACLALLLVACGSGSDDADEADDPGGTTSDAGAGSATLVVRVVVATSRAGAPDSSIQADFEALHCADPPSGVAPDQPLTTCDDDGVKYALEPAAVSADVVEAEAGQDPAGSTWQVGLTLDDEGAADLEALSRRLTRTGQQAALVVGDRVVTATTFASVLRGGRLVIAGDYTEAEARELADDLAA